MPQRKTVQAICCQKVTSREASRESLRASQRRKWGVLVWAVWCARVAQTS